MSSTRIVCSDGTIFDVSADICSKFKVISSVADELDEIFPVPVMSDIFEKIVDFYTFRKCNSTEWNLLEVHEKKFFETSPDVLFDIISAANFLDSSEILDHACAAVANLLRDKTPDEIRTILKIDSVYSRAEESEIMREHQWAFQT